jgi:Domain of unknown function (DUF4253)
MWEWLRKEPEQANETPDSAALAREAGLPDHVLAAMLREGTSPRRLEGMNDEGERYPAPGVVVTVPSGQGFDAVRRLRAGLGAGYPVFVAELGFGIRDEEVAVLRGDDPFLPVRVMGTNGANFDVMNDDVVERLQAWDARYGLVLTGAGHDWLQADFVTPPADMTAFAHEVYEFCPDVVDQGTETVEALAAEMAAGNFVYLWWD